MNTWLIAPFTTLFSTGATEELAREASFGSQVGAVVVFALAYLGIATEKLDKTTAALLGAAAVVAFHFVPYGFALASIDLNVIFLLIGMMIVMSILSDTGLFEWIAITVARAANGNGTMILLFFMTVTAVLSAFLDNVTTVILIAPITILVGQILGLPVMVFLILEALASNIGGTSTLIGDPPNVLIGSQAGLTFVEFIENLAPAVLVMIVVIFPVITLLFRKQLQVSEEARMQIMRAKPELAILDPVGLRRSLIVFSGILAAFFLHHAIEVEPGLIALGGAVILCWVCGKDLHHALERVEWASILFFVGLFMMVGALEYNGIFEALGRYILLATRGDYLMTLMAVLWFAAIVSAIVDNIPLVIAMIPLIHTIIPVFAEQQGLAADSPEAHAAIAMPLFWALALGACLGGNGTLVGASANVVVTQIARRNNYPITFGMFTFYGFPIMIVTLVISTIYLYLRYFVF
ncbi:MAG: hypothetical protein GC168_17225 [Candidatus Hydrogenedens sp.]|nr:hypothetical protein [Candidatus Hydrogenedens sp.]